MAVVAERLQPEEPDLLTRYLQARASRNSPFEGDSDGIRTCTHCGQRARFRIDPAGTWGTCPHCRTYA